VDQYPAFFELSTPQPIFRPYSYFSVYAGEQVFCVDLDGDGKRDVVTSGKFTTTLGTQKRISWAQKLDGEAFATFVDFDPTATKLDLTQTVPPIEVSAAPLELRACSDTPLVCRRIRFDGLSPPISDSVEVDATAYTTEINPVPEHPDQTLVLGLQLFDPSGKLNPKTIMNEFGPGPTGALEVQPSPFPYDGVALLATGDLDGDGHQELIEVMVSTSENATTTLVVFDAAAEERVRWSFALQASALRLADVNGDGVLWRWRVGCSRRRRAL
jgi:hypothetical protein